MSELTLYGESDWVSPWVFHVLVALEELGVRYKLETPPLPLPADRKAQLQRRGGFGKVPMLVHGEVWLSESSAISEYLAEQFAPPKYPRLLPERSDQRARARQVMSFMRTSLFGLREDRPTSSVFGRPDPRPLSDKAKADAAELVRIASHFVAPGKTQMFDTWSVADADLGLGLMRLVANSDPVPSHLLDYALAQWGRRSVAKYLSYQPTTR